MINKIVAGVIVLAAALVVLPPAFGGNRPAHGGRLDLDIIDFSCVEGKYYVRFGIINRFTYNRHPLLAFKILSGERVLGCETFKTSFPAGADGSEVHELLFDLDCQETEVILDYNIYERKSRGRANFWLSDCPH